MIASKQALSVAACLVMAGLTAQAVASSPGEDYILHLGGTSFDPVHVLPALPVGWDETDREGPDLHLVQFTGPTLPELVEGAWKNGTRTFRILPLFMASAGHVDKDIRPLVAGLRKRYPEGTIEMLPPVGEHPLFHALIPRIVETHRS